MVKFRQILRTNIRCVAGLLILYESSVDRLQRNI